MKMKTNGVDYNADTRARLDLCSCLNNDLVEWVRSIDHRTMNLGKILQTSLVCLVFTTNGKNCRRTPKAQLVSLSRQVEFLVVWLIKTFSALDTVVLSSVWLFVLIKLHVCGIQLHINCRLITNNLCRLAVVMDQTNKHKFDPAQFLDRLHRPTSVDLIAYFMG